jgi:hypothetical protein
MDCLVAVVRLEVGKESRMIEINQVEGVIQIKMSRELGKPIYWVAAHLNKRQAVNNPEDIPVSCINGSYFGVFMHKSRGSP